MDFKEKDIENLKVVMIKKYGKTNFNQLAKELGFSRRSVYNAINNKPYCENVKQALKTWLLENI